MHRYEGFGESGSRLLHLREQIVAQIERWRGVMHRPNVDPSVHRVAQIKIETLTEVLRVLDDKDEDWVTTPRP